MKVVSMPTAGDYRQPSLMWFLRSLLALSIACATLFAPQLATANGWYLASAIRAVLRAFM